MRSIGLGPHCSRAENASSLYTSFPRCLLTLIGLLAVCESCSAA